MVNFKTKRSKVRVHAEGIHPDQQMMNFVKVLMAGIEKYLTVDVADLY
jgi:hypothetical protein